MRSCRGVALWGMVALIAAGLILMAGCEGKKETMKVAVVPPPVKPAEKPKAEPPKAEPVQVEPPKAEPAPAAKASAALDLTNVYNNDAFKPQTEPTGGLDGFGDTFIADKMPQPKDGGMAYVDGKTTVKFSIPDLTKMEKNNIAANGENIPVTEGNYAALYLVATATNGEKEVELSAEYDTGKKTAPLKLTDWCKDAAFGEAVYAKLEQRNAPKGAEDKVCYIWIQKVALDADAKLKAITLPVNSDVHIFAMTLAPK